MSVDDYHDFLEYDDIHGVDDPEAQLLPSVRRRQANVWQPAKQDDRAAYARILAHVLRLLEAKLPAHRSHVVMVFNRQVRERLLAACIQEPTSAHWVKFAARFVNDLQNVVTFKKKADAKKNT